MSKKLRAKATNVSAGLSTEDIYEKAYKNYRASQEEETGTVDDEVDALLTEAEDESKFVTPEEQLQFAMGDGWDSDTTKGLSQSALNIIQQRLRQSREEEAKRDNTVGPWHPTPKDKTLDAATVTAKRYGRDTGNEARADAIAAFDIRRSSTARAADYLTRNSGEVQYANTSAASPSGLTFNTAELMGNAGSSTGAVNQTPATGPKKGRATRA